MGTDIHVMMEMKKTLSVPSDKWGESEEQDFWVNVDPKSSEDSYKDYDEVWQKRDYPLFGLLVGIRCSDLGMIRTRTGFPLDVSLKTIERFTRLVKGMYAHTPCHYTLKELEDFLEEHKDKSPNNSSVLFGDDNLKRGYETIQSLINCIYERAFKVSEIDGTLGFRNTRSGEDCRIVFWFDN